MKRLTMVLLALCTAVACAPTSPTVSVAAPARLQRALSVVSDLGCQARLSTADGDDDVVVVDLERGDDGVTFSGFLEAPEGSYILDLTFSGVADVDEAGGERRFLGRLRSDTIRVLDGDVASPVFRTGLDTIGGPDDGGDDDNDNDGLGFIDELILGSSPDSADSDNDGISDGDDCRPASPVVAFAIADGGSVDDCDADGFIGIDPVFADAGNDCDDEDAAINPAAEDDCGTLSDEDCNSSTCPVNDAEGPRIVVSAPEEGSSAGCGSRIVAAIDDESGVESAFATFVDDPFDQGARIVVLNETATDGVWQSQPISLSAGLGVRDGAHLLEVKAFDGTGNSASVNVNFDLVTELADVSIAGPAIVSGAPQTVTFSASSAADIVRFVVFSSSPSPQAPSTFDLSTQTLVDELPVTGGAVSLDPADFDERAVIYDLRRR